MLGKKQLYRNLKTRDLNEAIHLKYGVVGELKAQIEAARRSLNQEATKEERLLETARLLKEQRGNLDVSHEILQQNVYKIFGDEATDYAFHSHQPNWDSEQNVPGLIETVQKAFKIISEDSYTISQASKWFLEEESRRIKNSTIVRKKKKIREFIKWFGDDLIKEVDKESAGRFVTEYIMPQRLAHSTSKAFVLDLSTFFNLCKD